MQVIRHRFEVWQEDDGDTMAGAADIEAMKAQGTMAPSAKLIHVIEAATTEEARSIWNLRRGYEPYHPAGESEPCPKGCGAYYYPEGSGECPYCGRIC